MSSNTDNNESLTIPDKIAMNPTVAARYSISEKRDGDVEYIRASVAAVEGDARRLTLPELNHLSVLLEAERESGEYAGPREQYYARTERLMKWCGKQIKQIAKREKRNGKA